jgi:cell division septation protein DedD
MSSTSENETEILLGNRHLLAIFFVLAVLLGIAFTGGYMVGRNGSDKKPAAAANGADPVASTTTGAETLTVPPAAENNDTPQVSDHSHTAQSAAPPPQVDVVQVPIKEDRPLGARKDERETEAPAATTIKPTPPKTGDLPSRTKTDHFSVPQSGQTFLQVAAVGRTEANALAEVLSRKGFHAHAVAKPGSNDTYRVLIGPIHDASDLSSTRDSLRNAGFTKIFPQKY